MSPQNLNFTRALAGLSLFFATTLPSPADDTTIGLAVANLQADFFNQIKQSVDAEAKAKGVKLIVADAKGDSATQVDQMQDLMTRGVKAIIYIPAGATAAGVPVKAAKRLTFPSSTWTGTPLTPPATRSSPRIVYRRLTPSAITSAR